MEDAPRILIDEPAPGSPEVDTICMPGIFPCKAVLIFPPELESKSLEEIVVIEPIISRLA